jgi:hypothetical protein
VTVASAGVQVLLTQALRFFLNPDFIEAFRESLRLKLSGDTRHALDALRKRASSLEALQERYSRLLAGDPEDGVMEKRYIETRAQVRETQAKLGALEAGQAKLDERAIEAQLTVDPGVLLDDLFAADVPPEKLRALLSRLFPAIVFAGKKGRYAAFFSIEFAAGAALSIASGTGTVDVGAVTRHFALRYLPDYRSGRGPGWNATAIDAADMPKAREPRALRTASVALGLLPVPTMA